MFRKEKDKCSSCEVFKNHEDKEKNFSLIFHCPMVNEIRRRDDMSCEYFVSDELPF